MNIFKYNNNFRSRKSQTIKQQDPYAERMNARLARLQAEKERKVNEANSGKKDPIIDLNMQIPKVNSDIFY